MRFTIAAALLAHSLPATSEDSSTSTVASPDFSKKLEKQIYKTVYDGLDGESRGTFISLLKEKKAQSASFRLKNAEQKQKEELLECDPESDEVDVGVLSCGVGRYCVESDESKKGGYCVSNLDEMDRGLQDDPASLFVSLSSLFCNTDAYYYDVCNCTNADPEAYTLEVDCARPEECTEFTSDCGVNVTSCTTYDFSFSLSGPGSYGIYRCIEDSLPYAQKTCYQSFSYGSGVAESCLISVNDEDCISCAVSADTEGDSCYVFDCTNTLSRRAGSRCTPGVYVSPVLYYLRIYGCDYYTCDVCGADNVATNPGGLIDLGDGQTTCAAVASYALLGGFNETFCQDVVIPGVAAPSGCVPFGSPPVAVPTEAPVETAATDTPSVTGQFPTIAPVEFTFPPVTPAPSPSGATSRYAVASSVVVASIVCLSMMALSQLV
jgi:hypothetical protein